MTWIAILVLIVYAALKSGQLAFIGRAAGYRGDPIPFAHRLRTGEPALLITATLITVPPALAGAWYHKHKFEKVLSASVTCYGLVHAYRNAPEIKHTNGEHAVYESIYGFRWSAFDASRQLGSDVAATQRRLDAAVLTRTAESSRRGGVALRERLSDTQSCLHPPKESPNA